MLIRNGLVFTGEGKFAQLDVVTDGDLIGALLPPGTADTTNQTVVDATGCYVIPGLTDIHFHGCDGFDFCDDSLEACEHLASFELQHGVTSICPATMTLSADKLRSICQTAAAFRDKQHLNPALEQADLIGVHMEGPFISPSKKGAQNEAFIQKPDRTLVRRFLSDSKGLVKLISLAPERDGAIACIAECKDEVAFSIAHTEANYATAMAALQAGANHVTHTFNAMPPFHHRDSGVIGAAFDQADCFAELICDGIHISAPVVRAAFRLFAGRIILISDSMRAAGKPDGTYTLGGLEVTVHGQYATLANGTLAGSVTPLYECMRTAVSMGIPLEDAVTAATITPCRSIGMDGQYGSLEPGKKAHLLLLDQQTLDIRQIIKGSVQLPLSALH